MITRPMISYILSTRRRSLVGCEVGVLFGANAEDILRMLPMTRLYLVDAYRNDPNYRGGDHIKIPQEEVYAEARRRMEPYADIVRWIIMDSQLAVLRINEELDFIYLDANREYEYIRNDINAYYRVIKSGGWIGGAGYGTDWPGATRAADEFAAKINVSISAEYNYSGCRHMDWWLQKP